MHQILKAMMTKEEVAQVIAYCDENKISYKQRLSELGISPWNFYDDKRKYAPKKEGENVASFPLFSQIFPILCRNKASPYFPVWFKPLLKRLFFLNISVYGQEESDILCGRLQLLLRIEA